MNPTDTEESGFTRLQITVVYNRPIKL